MNKPYLAHSSSTVDLLATDSVNSSTTVIKKIRFIDRKFGFVFNEFIIKIEVDNKKDNVFNVLRSRKITGTFEIIHQNQVIVKTHVINGVEGSTEHYGVEDSRGSIGPTNGKLSMAPNLDPCTFSGVHDCVSERIKAMGWVEYGLCLTTAPECYAAQWLICDFQVCRPSLGTNQL